MSHNATNTRIYGNVDTSDVKAVVGLTSDTDDVGTLIRTAVAQNKINKWAKWKPYQAIEVDLPSDDLRRTAGWNQFGRKNIDEGFVYGVRGGVGITTSVAGLHNSGFNYEGPHGETYEEGGVTKRECYRLSDFKHPSDINYGYRADATMDLSAEFTWLGTVQKTMITDSDSAFVVHIHLSPHSSTEREEMLSIYDFLKREDQTETSQLEPTDCWPCILIDNKLHGLYPYNNGNPGTNIGKLTTGDTYWTISLPSSTYATGSTATMSIILVRCPDGMNTLGTYTPRLSGDTTTCIKNWVDMGADDQVWGAYFCGVPDGCGITVTFATSGSYGATVANVEAVTVGSLTSTAIEAIVAYRFSAAYTGSVTVTITVTLTYTPRSGTATTETLGTYTINVTNPTTRPGLLQVNETLENILYGTGTVKVSATIETTIGLSTQAGTPGDTTVNFPMS
ncbi:MAG: hypothetical protein IJ363_14015 [Clostridia bacterium]|nr:hypothetical protein [Clostridia bacterium]